MFSQQVDCELKTRIEDSIGKRFLKIAETYPSHVAIQTPTTAVSYGELATKSRQLAQLINSYHPNPGDRIVIGFHQAEDIVSAILATLMLGCIYVPIETNFPSERIQYIMNDTQPVAILIERQDYGLLTCLTKDQQARISFLEDAEFIEPLPLEIIYADSDVPASILYTSGSTGQPKGVLQTQRNLLFHIDTLIKRFNITPQDKQSVLSSFVFDGSTSDLYCALLSGATLVAINLQTHGVIALGDFLQQYGVTLYHSTPTTYRSLLNHYQKPLKSVRVIILGGEAVTGHDFSLYQQFFTPECLFVNGYGATETSGFVALYVANRDKSYSEQVLPIGREPMGFELLLKNQDSQETNQGELFIKSRYISLGYWQAPELTARSFQVDPLRNDHRIYKTGDWAIRDEAGNIRLLGRVDRQVKIRGYRVDPNEIEAIVLEMSEILQSIVKPYRDERTGTEELILFVTLVSNPKNIVNIQTIREALIKRLPSYMIPTHIVILEQFPLTTTGKIDVKALPNPEQQKRIAKPNWTSEDSLSQWMAKCWIYVLQLENINPEDNFFDLGGSSLLMTSVQALVMEQLKLSIPLYRFYEHPTLNQLIRFLETASERPDFSEILQRMKKRQIVRGGLTL